MMHWYEEIRLVKSHNASSTSSLELCNTPPQDVSFLSISCADLMRKIFDEI
jgi:hypothetical protein